MKAFLMYKDHNFDSAVQLPANAQSLIQDLELNSLFTVMADNDKFLFEITQKVILNSLLDKTTIIYRQTVLTDCLKNPAVIKTIYDLSIEAIECEKKQYLWRINKYPSAILHRALNVLHSFMKLLKNLRNIAENEREGSEISEQIVQALLESHIKVFFVTHQYTFANKFYQKNSTAVLFLRAERKIDKKRTFKLIEGGPLSTSYGADLYYKIF
ncbi:hypothetical protein [Pectinatus frisingensis]|uniref:hypothetical protein n=1 Tax=Pectinatus frisingensis TaxID=865 RepID=UPI0018C58C96|nr:hypothetical protein [Pectinatus frisingensis]